MPTLAPSPAPPLQLIRGRFRDIDELNESMREWTVDLRQLDRGALTADVVHLGSESVGVSRFRFDRKVEQRGCSTHGGRGFGFIGSQTAGVRWCGRQVTPTTVQVFPAGGEFEAVSEPGFRADVVWISHARLADVALQIGFPGPVEVLGHHGAVIECRASSVSVIRTRIERLREEVEARPALLRSTSVKHEIEYELPRLLLEAVARDGAGTIDRPSNLRGSALERARSFIEEHANQALTVQQVAAAASVSVRTLEYAFREHLMTTPKHYLKLRRLHGVRRELRSSDAQTRIADVANRWGFWHMGQFAADYRRYFGELPSDTLFPGTVAPARK